MPTVRGIALAVILFSWCAGAFATTGNELARFCGVTEGGPANRAICGGYIAGVYETALELAKAATPTGAQRRIGICAAEGVTSEQFEDVVKSHLRRTPATRHLPAPGLVLRALETAFPCK